MEKILIIDDAAADRRLLAGILEDSYTLFQASGGEEGLALAYDKAAELSLVLLDIALPDTNSYQVLRRLKSGRLTRHIPVMLIGSLDSDIDESRGLREGAIDYITKPFNAHLVQSRVHNHIQLKLYQDQLQQIVDQRTEKILHLRESVFDAVASIIEYRSLESGRHVRRIRLYCESQLKYLLKNRMFPDQLDERSAELIARASSLHDVGKVGIPDCILTKPGKLTEEEFKIMKTHALIGSEFIDSLTDTEDEEYIRYAREICRHHHERWDGTGYPDELKGEQIPLSARIAAIADVYDALVSRRVYKKSYSHQQAIGMMLSQAGMQFDPTLIDVLSRIHDQFEQISIAHGD